MKLRRKQMQLCNCATAQLRQVHVTVRLMSSQNLHHQDAELIK